MPNKEYSNLQKNFYQTGTVVFVGLILLGLYKLSNEIIHIINILGFSVLISYLLIGLVDWLQAKTRIRSRGLIVTFVYFLVVLIFALFAIFILPLVIAQISHLADRIPGYFQQLALMFENLKETPAFSTFLSNFTIDFGDLAAQISSVLSSFSKEVAPRILSFAFNTINFAIYLLVTIVLSIYFLIDGPRIWTGVIKPLSREYLEHAERLRSDLSRCLRGYIVGQIQLASLSGLVIFIICLALQSKYALLLGLLQGILEIIPVVGGFFGIALVAFVLFFNSSWIKALIAVVLYFTYTQIIKDNLITPRIMSNVINLHPVVVLVVILLGAEMGGLAGIIFAIPLAGLLNVVLNYYIENRYKKSLPVSESSADIVEESDNESK